MGACFEVFFDVVLCGCFWEEKEWYCSCRIPYANSRKLLDVQLHLLEPLLLQNVSPFFCIWTRGLTIHERLLVVIWSRCRDFSVQNVSFCCLTPSLVSPGHSCLEGKGEKWATGWKNRRWPVWNSFFVSNHVVFLMRMEKFPVTKNGKKFTFLDIREKKNEFQNGNFWTLRASDFSHSLALQKHIRIRILHGLNPRFQFQKHLRRRKTSQNFVFRSISAWSSGKISFSCANLGCIWSRGMSITLRCLFFRGKNALSQKASRKVPTPRMISLLTSFTSHLVGFVGL